MICKFIKLLFSSQVFLLFEENWDYTLPWGKSHTEAVPSAAGDRCRAAPRAAPSARTVTVMEVLQSALCGMVAAHHMRLPSTWNETSVTEERNYCIFILVHLNYNFKKPRVLPPVATVSNSVGQGSNPSVLLLLTSGLSEIGFVYAVYMYTCVCMCTCAYVCLCVGGGACINEEHSRTSHGAS